MTNDGTNRNWGELANRAYDEGTGIIRNLFLGGAILLGGIIIGAALAGRNSSQPLIEKRKEYPQDWLDFPFNAPLPDWRRDLIGTRNVPFGLMEFVRTSHGEFFGICLDDKLTIKGPTGTTEVPIQNITSLRLVECMCSKCRRIYCGNYEPSAQLQIDLIDGSKLTHAAVIGSLRYATAGGIIELNFEHVVEKGIHYDGRTVGRNLCYEIKGLKANEVEKIALRIQDALIQHRNAVEALLKDSELLKRFYGISHLELTEYLPPGTLTVIVKGYSGYSYIHSENILTLGSTLNAFSHVERHSLSKYDFWKGFYVGNSSGGRAKIILANQTDIKYGWIALREDNCLILAVYSGGMAAERPASIYDIHPGKPFAVGPHYELIWTPLKK